MSAEATARPLPSVAPAESPGRERGRLRVVESPRPRRRPRLAYALVAVAGALVIAAAQIGLSLAITSDSFVLADLSSQQRELDLQTHALQDELAGTASPQQLALQAQQLGMVVVGSASYLRLSDAAVLGAGEETAWHSSVDPAGAGAVHNALLAAQEAVDAPVEEAPPVDGAVEELDPDLPPPLTDGLPSPTTH